MVCLPPLLSPRRPLSLSPLSLPLSCSSALFLFFSAICFFFFSMFISWAWTQGGQTVQYNKVTISNRQDGKAITNKPEQLLHGQKKMLKEYKNVSDLRAVRKKKCLNMARGKHQSSTQVSHRSPHRYTGDRYIFHFESNHLKTRTIEKYFVHAASRDCGSHWRKALDHSWTAELVIKAQKCAKKGMSS